MDEFAIQMSQVSKRFGAHSVLNELDLKVPKESIFAFLGNNGEGKSTVIRLIVGLLQPDQGYIKVLGKDILKERRLILDNIGCLVDSPSLYPNLTAREFLRIACTIKALPYSEVDRALDLVKLKIDNKRLISQFSLGMKQRLALAHALIGKPKLLILDEPMNGLDPFGIQEIRQLIRSLPEEEKCTVFVSSHQLDEVEKIATHVALLKSGKALFQSSLQAIKAQYEGVLNLYVDDAQSAAKLMSNFNLKTHVINSGHLYVHGVSRELIHQINARLVHSKIRLYQSIFEQDSLEQWFHSQTQELVSCS
jgi:ABC-type multidrug transport system ATPase subunit